MAKPTTLPVFATDATYTSGPKNGQNTKVAMDSGDTGQGNIPEQPPDAQKFNWWMHWVCQWLAYVDELDPVNLLTFYMDASTGETAPEDQSFKLNASPPTVASKLFVDDQNTSGNTVFRLLNTFSSGRVIITDATLSAVWVYNITSVTDHAGYSEWAIELVSGSGSLINDQVYRLIVDVTSETASPGARYTWRPNRASGTRGPAEFATFEECFDAVPEGSFAWIDVDPEDSTSLADIYGAIGADQEYFCDGRIGINMMQVPLSWLSSNWVMPAGTAFTDIFAWLAPENGVLKLESPGGGPASNSYVLIQKPGLHVHLKSLQPTADGASVRNLARIDTGETSTLERGLTLSGRCIVGGGPAQTITIDGAARVAVGPHVQLLEGAFEDIAITEPLALDIESENSFQSADWDEDWFGAITVNNVREPRRWIFDSTVGGTPGEKTFRLDNASESAAGALLVHDTNVFGTNVEHLLQKSGTLFVTIRTPDGAKRIQYTASSAQVFGSHTQLVVDYYQGTNDLADGEAYLIEVEPAESLKVELPCVFSDDPTYGHSLYADFDISDLVPDNCVVSVTAFMAVGLDGDGDTDDINDGDSTCHIPGTVVVNGGSVIRASNAAHTSGAEEWFVLPIVGTSVVALPTISIGAGGTVRANLQISDSGSYLGPDLGGRARLVVNTYFSRPQVPAP